MTFGRTAALAAILSAATTGAALAEWPTDRPIEVIVAFAPGGGTDIMLRALAPILEAQLDTQIPILNRPGAAGEITYTALTQADPDGYTLSSLNTPSFLTMRIGKELRFDPAAICPVARIVEDPSMLVVKGDSEFNSLDDLVAYAKENPGGVSVGTTGAGTDEHMVMLQLEQATGADMTAVPFAGSSETRTALLGGHVTAIGLNIGDYVTAEPGMFKPLAQFSEERSTLLPDLPTGRELGADVLMSSERGIATRCDVPQEIRDKLSAAVETAVASPEFQAAAKQQSLALAYLSGADWTAAMTDRLARFEEIYKLIEGGQ